MFDGAQAAYRTDESCSRFHGAEARVSYLQGEDLGTGGDTVALRLFWEVTCCDTGYVCPMSPLGGKNNNLKTRGWVLWVPDSLKHTSNYVMWGPIGNRPLTAFGSII